MKDKKIAIFLMLGIVVVFSAGWGGWSILRGRAIVLTPAAAGSHVSSEDGAIQINTGSLGVAPGIGFKCGGQWYAVTASSVGE